MKQTWDRLYDRFRRGIAPVKASLSKFLASISPANREVATQRICPFCSLITPRSNAFCLECGKSFAPAK
jgi:hypothetical protein